MHVPRCVLCKLGRDGYVKTQPNFTKFIMLTTCFGRCGPSSGHKSTKKTICYYSKPYTNTYVCTLHIVFLVLLWPEDGPQRPKHVVNIIKLVKIQLCSEVPTPQLTGIWNSPTFYSSDTYSIVACLQLLSTDMDFWRSAARTSRLLKVRNEVIRDKWGQWKWFG